MFRVYVLVGLGFRKDFMITQEVALLLTSVIKTFNMKFIYNDKNCKDSISNIGTYNILFQRNCKVGLKNKINP